MNHLYCLLQSSDVEFLTLIFVVTTYNHAAKMAHIVIFVNNKEINTNTHVEPIRYRMNSQNI